MLAHQEPIAIVIKPKNGPSLLGWFFTFTHRHSGSHHLATNNWPLATTFSQSVIIARMPDYHPTSRRPIAGLFRRTATAAVHLCVKQGVHPDTISYLSVVAAAGAGVCFYFSARWPFLLILAPILCVARLWFNMLDGMVALASGKASLRGEIVNELPDRVSDILIFVGVAYSNLDNTFIAYWAAIMAIMTAYIGTLGQAVTGKRRFEGLMSKQHRMMLLVVGSWTAFFWRGMAGGLSVLDWTLIVLVVGCLQTIVVRLMKMLKDLRSRQAGEKGPHSDLLPAYREREKDTEQVGGAR